MVSRRRRVRDDELGVADTAAKLAEELRASEQEERRERDRAARERFDFDHPDAATHKPLAREVVEIIETLVVPREDIRDLAKRLTRELRVGERRSEFGVTQKALDDAEANARDAHRLYVTAYQTRRDYERDNELVYSAMRTAANGSLQDEKRSKERSKTITERDIDCRAAEMFPDQWRVQEEERDQLKMFEESMKNLAETWLSRCRSLNTLHGKAR